MKRFIILTLSILWLLAPATVYSESSEQAYQKARDSYYALQNSSRKQMYRENWERVYNQFQSVYMRFPETRRGADSLYMCAKTTAGLYTVSRIKPDAQRAVELFVQMAEAYPDSSLADDALLQAGKLSEETGTEILMIARWKNAADRSRNGIRAVNRFMIGIRLRTISSSSLLLIPATD